MQAAEKIPSNASTSLSEYDAITRTVQTYINGGKSGRGADMKPAFHPDATIFGYIGPDLFAEPIQGLFDWNDQNGPATELQGRITSIDIIDTIATVRLELDNCPKLAGCPDSNVAARSEPLKHDNSFEGVIIGVAAIDLELSD